MTRCRSRWPLAIALMLTVAAPAAFAQAPQPLTPAPLPPASLPQPGPPPAPAPPPANFPPPVTPGGPPGVAAVVNGVSISRDAVQHAVTTLPAYQQALQQALQQVIANALVDQEAKKQAVTVTPAEVDDRVAGLRQRLATQAGAPTLETFLKSNGTTIDDLRDNLRVRLEAEKLAEKGQPAVRRAHIHYIVVLTTNPSGDPTKKPHTDAEAKAIIAKAQADLKAKQTFEAVAAKYTEDSGKTTGGDIGIVSPDSPLDAAFVQAALALKPGEVTATPVHSAQFGYFLLKAVSTSAQPGADAALYDQANQQSSRQAVQTYFQTLLKNATITNYFTP